MTCFGCRSVHFHESMLTGDCSHPGVPGIVIGHESRLAVTIDTSPVYSPEAGLRRVLALE